MSRKMRNLGIVLSLLVLLIGLAGLGLWQWLNPTWAERLAFADGRIFLTDIHSGEPIEGAVVVRVVGKGIRGGGWGGGGATPPERGEDQHELHSDLLNLNVTSTRTDVAGRCRIDPFQADCSGKRQISPFGGGRDEHGYMRVLIYKRGYAPTVVAPPVNQPMNSDIELYPIEPLPEPDKRVQANGRQTYDVKQNRMRFVTQSVALLEKPFWYREQLVRAYLTHQMSDGRLVVDWLADELRWLADQSPSEDQQQRVMKIIKAIQTQDPQVIRSAPMP